MADHVASQQLLGRWVGVTDYLVGVEHEDRRTIGFEKLVIARLRRESVGGGSFDAGMGESLSLDAVSDEESDNHDDRESDQVAGGHAFAVG